MTKRIDDSAALLSTRRQVLMAGAAAGAAMLLPRVVRAADIAFTYDCDRGSAFIMDPNQHKRFGYVTEFNGLGLTNALAKDLTVIVPWNANSNPTYAGLAPSAPKAAGAPATAQVVGIIEKFSWNGGVGDPLKINFFMSQQNAVLLKTLQQSTSKNNLGVSALGWWIANYDQETKVWYEQSFPATPGKITGIVGPKDNPELNVDLTPVPVKNGIDVNVYKVSLAITPAANKQYPLNFANAANKPIVKQWGLVVGTLANKAGL
jgi:hypothetical protein